MVAFRRTHGDHRIPEIFDCMDLDLGNQQLRDLERGLDCLHDRGFHQRRCLHELHHLLSQGKANPTLAEEERSSRRGWAEIDRRWFHSEQNCCIRIWEA